MYYWIAPVAKWPDIKAKQMLVSKFGTYELLLYSSRNRLDHIVSKYVQLHMKERTGLALIRVIIDNDIENDIFNDSLVWSQRGKNLPAGACLFELRSPPKRIELIRVFDVADNGNLLTVKKNIAKNKI